MSTLHSQWDSIQKEVVVCREHQLFYAGAPTAVLKHPYLNQLLPGLVLIRAVCLFEEALREYLLGKGTSNNKTKDASLNSLIKLSSVLKEIAADEGHDVRKIRNEIAHEQKTISLDELELILQKIEGFLNVDIPNSFSRKSREIRATTKRLSPPEADPSTTIHMRTTGILKSDDGEEETVFSYDARC